MGGSTARRRAVAAGLALVGAFAIAVGVASAPAAPVDPRLTCNPDGVERAPSVTVVEAVVKPVGAADWQAWPSTVLICSSESQAIGPLPTGAAVRFRYVSEDGQLTGSDVRAAMPPGTRYRLRLQTSASLEPMTSLSGWIANPEFTISGRDVTIEGDVVETLIAGSGDDPSTRPCPPAGTQGNVSVDLLMRPRVLEVPGTVYYNSDGIVYGTNAWMYGHPTISSAGLFFSITGCGDADPSTKEGFAHGFLPAARLAEMGIPQATFETAPPEAIDGFLQMLNNSVPDGGAVFSRVTRGGVIGAAFEYRTSYSAHELGVRPDADNLNAIRVCAALGKPVASSAGAEGRTVVTCSAKLRYIKRPAWALSGSKGAKRRTATLEFAATTGVRYRVSAVKGATTRTGTCVVKKGVGRCTVRLVGKGRWAVAVTPTKGDLVGEVVRRSFTL